MTGQTPLVSEWPAVVRPVDVDRVLQGIGHVLLAARQSAELSRKQVVRRLLPLVGLNIGERTLMSYELMAKDEGPLRGGRPVSISTLLQLAAVYDRSAPVLLAEAMRLAEVDPCCPTCGAFPGQR